VKPAPTKGSITDPDKAPPPYPSAGWIAVGVVQVVGTLLGLLIGLAVFVVAFHVLRRVGWVNLGPLIRVEISDTRSPLVDVAASGVAGAFANASGTVIGPWHTQSRHSEPELETPVADFRDQSVAFQPPGMTYEEQQRALAEQRKEQEKEILRRILDENLALRERMSGRMPTSQPAPARKEELRLDFAALEEP
jgi:hypothetical protein